VGWGRNLPELLTQIRPGYRKSSGRVGSSATHDITHALKQCIYYLPCHCADAEFMNPPNLSFGYIMLSLRSSVLSRKPPFIDVARSFSPGGLITSVAMTAHIMPISPIYVHILRLDVCGMNKHMQNLRHCSPTLAIF
jgi:hypothetical protein